MQLFLRLSALLLVVVQFANSRGVLSYDEDDLGDAQCSGTPNQIQPWTGEPSLVRRVENGTLYTAGDGEDAVHLLHVYGDHYSMGYAHGVLLEAEISTTIPSFYQHIEKEIEDYISFIPRDVRDLIAKYGLDGALDLTYELTKEYIPSYFIDELQGVAKGSGLDYKLLLRLHMLPELVKAGCSMLGGWGSALADHDGMIQLRALDWDTSGPLQNSPTVVIYHPTIGNGNAFANAGWAGWIGTLSGMSIKKMGISEKHSDIPFSRESRVGIPFTFLTRDILQFDNTLFDAINRIENAKRTCSIWLGVGDGNLKAFRLVEYSASTAKFFDEKNVTEIDEQRFNKEHCDDQCYGNYTFPDLIYWGVHLGCWNDELHTHYGSMDAQSVIEMAGRVQTGELQAVIYDLANLKMYVSNARAANESGKDNAYDRQFVQLDLSQLFNTPKPVFLT